MEESMNKHDKLTPEEKRMLKEEVRETWYELPLELRELMVEVKRQKLKVMYMLQDWAKHNGHETMTDLLSRAISHKEAKLQEIEKSLED